MKHKLKTNIGAADQRRHELPSVKDDDLLMEGDVIDVGKKVGEFLVKKGWAVPLAAAVDDAKKK